MLQQGGILIEKYNDLFNQCMDNLNRYYCTGYYDRMYRIPDLWKQLVAIEDELNMFWGKNLKMFKKALLEYYKYQKKCFEEFRL